MRPEVDIYGVYIPTLGAMAVIAFFINAILRRALATTGFYRLVWHRPLFDTALYFCLLGALVLTINRIPL
ncbi:MULTISPECIES: DUF1656 domain-containing protein [unclassified Rhizobium]|uniref:DUF1656 domain-containing protein n=1 Tax=unclassified Rhizobium TaxID=2613769 RepID=UPI001ADCAF32|nr:MULTISPECIES: DUF1656 domain-containing protein [unclassified Rhizobium]MBO9096725.1 DUF1656 domain-containing protein [Rhizobium sp. L58/93]MBO9134402.1 DUF1656 domain-containing protein [Rhizobium sp. B209b/85]MBO9166980.1 DUF1656 domain-containing protein [Rhizobium sp. L245/93]MBO9182952.1 DUF1656 domain-containing protein [Rhizobium sp. E27B/91]QXZ83321.1 DUF1656 domain-containing protein [Rhizobium sp. K1/93]